MFKRSKQTSMLFLTSIACRLPGLLPKQRSRLAHPPFRSAWTPSVPPACRPNPSVVCAPKHAAEPLWFPVTSSISFDFKRYYAAKKGGGKKGKKPVSIDDMLDELGDDEDDREAVADAYKEVPDSPAAKFIVEWDKTRGLGKGKRKEKAASHSVALGYHEVNALVPIERYWSEMEGIVAKQRHFFVHSLTVRSTNALDDLEVELDGDKFPLKEVANVSKRDPKRLVIDTSTFPQVTVNVMNALRSSALNLNPQQEGTRVYVPIPKVTKEHRETLAKAAKTRFTETKAEMQALQNKHVRSVADSELAKSAGVHKDDFQAAKAIIMAIEHHFVRLAEADCHKKQGDISGGKHQ